MNRSLYFVICISCTVGAPSSERKEYTFQCLSRNGSRGSRSPDTALREEQYLPSSNDPHTALGDNADYSHSSDPLTTRVYQGWLTLAEGDKVEALKDRILQRERNPPIKRNDETEEEFQNRLLESNKIFNRAQKCELKYIDRLQKEYGENQDEVVRLYQRRVEERRNRKRRNDHVRYLKKQGRFLELKAAQGLLGLQKEDRETNHEAVDSKRDTLAHKLHRKSQNLSLAKMRIRRAAENGANPEVIVRRMKKWGLDSLGDARVQGSFKTAIRRKLHFDPNNEKLITEAERLGMNPMVQPTPSKRKKDGIISLEFNQEEATSSTVRLEDSGQRSSWNAEWDLNSPFTSD